MNPLFSSGPMKATPVTQDPPYEVINENTEECNEKRNFIINTIKDFLEINFSDAHVLAVLYRQYSYFVERGTNRVRPNTVANYIKKKDENILFERIVFNKYAQYHGIRYEDSIEIIQKFISTIELP
jgi:hypothetical protein